MHMASLWLVALFPCLFSSLVYLHTLRVEGLRVDTRGCCPVKSCVLPKPHCSVHFAVLCTSGEIHCFHYEMSPFISL